MSIRQHFQEFYCMLSFFRVENEIPCEPGTYSLGNQTVCTVCEAGYMCPDAEGASIEPCVAGTFSLAQATECTDCPLGKACPDTNSTLTQVECSPGNYSLGRQTECTPCPAGL